MTNRLSNIEGQKFGRLVVLKRVGTRSGQALWLCRCDCGGVKETVGYCLRSGQTQSCGCLQKERTGSVQRTHGMRKSRLYYTWAQMRERCEKPSSPAFKYYGAKGVKVCARWQDFANFIADMGMPPKGCTLDRIDNSGDYKPGNVRWADKVTQAKNRSSVRWITFNGKTQCIADWARELGMGRKTIRHRLNQGLAPEQILRTDPRADRKRKGSK